MNLLLSATHTVVSTSAAEVRYARWLGYHTVEAGVVSTDLAQAWAAPASAGRRYVVMQPESGAEVFLRFIEGDPVANYLPIRSYGWAAMEICVTDVLAVNQRMLADGSPFEVIGPPKRIPGIDTIYPMQVRGPDLETVYFTQFLTDDPASGLPVAGSMIDKLFIMVLASPDMARTAEWFAQTFAFEVSAPIEIPYTMISRAFGQPMDTPHAIATATWEGSVFLEFDQYPAETVQRPAHGDALPPGVSICSITYPDPDALAIDWLCPPVARDGAIYRGRRVGVVRTPEGALLEVVAQE